MGPQSTGPYYLGIVYGVQEKTNDTFFPNLTIESLNVFEILKMIEDEKYEELTDHFLKALTNLKNAGAEFAALTANTAHIVFDRLKDKSPLPLISIVESTCDEAIRRGYSRVGLLGTIFTMKRDFYKEPFIRKGVEVIIPKEEELGYIDEKITSELEYGIVTKETEEQFIRIIKRMAEEDGIQAVILGCTELPLLLSDDNSPIPCLDTVKIHTQDIIRNILQ